MSCRVRAEYGQSTGETDLQAAAGDGLTWHGDVDGMALPPAYPDFTEQA